MKSTIKSALFILVCSCLAGLLAACQPQNVTPPVVSIPQGFSGGSGLTPTLEPTPSLDQVRSVVVKALLALNTMPNQMDVTSVTADGQAHKNVIEFIPPDRKRILSEGTETIVAGGKVYLKSSPTDPWQEVQIAASTYLGDQPVTEQSLMAYVEGGEYVRSDALDGRLVKIYRYGSTTISGGISLHSQIELWVGQADGLPYKMVTDGDTLAISLDPATGENKAVAVQAQSTTTIVFNPSLNIEPPLP